jgi:hypothetical protein
MPSSTRKPGYAERITYLLRTRGANVGLEARPHDAGADIAKLPIYRQDIPIPVHPDTVMGPRDLSQEDREQASRSGSKENAARHKERRVTSAWNRGVADAVGRGFTRPSRISEENNMNLKEHYKQILNSQLNEGRGPKPMVPVKKVKDASPGNENIRKETDRIKSDGQRDLKGNQSKLDQNKNGKLDGEDFKILRNKK